MQHTARAGKWCQDLLPNTFSSKHPSKHEICTRTAGVVKRSFGDDANAMPKIVSHLGRHGRICESAIIRTIVRLDVYTQGKQERDK